MKIHDLLTELKRRRVFRAAAIYAVVAWAVIQVGDVVAPRIGLPDSAVTLLIFLAALGFPLVIVVSWLFERTPAGLRRTIDTVPLNSRSRAVGYIGVGMIMGLVLLGAYWRMAPRDGEQRDEYANSVAVLPFVDMSENKDQEFFGDGITEEILNVLAKVPGLRVPARTSAFSFKDKDLPIREIGNQLGVAHVLEGSIRKSGTRIRITAQLIDARTDKPLWSDQFDRDVADVFAVQGEIARAIVEALKLRIGSNALVESETKSAEAHERYLKGLYYWHRRHRDELPQGLDEFKAAVREDPGYAKAHAGLALMYAVLPQYSDFDRPTAIREGKAAAQRALELDPSSSAAHAALGQIAQQLEWDWAAAESHLTSALQLDPKNATAHQWQSELHTTLGRFDDGSAAIDRALALDPLSSVIRDMRANLLDRAGRTNEAVALWRDILATDPGFRNARGMLVRALVRSGRFEEARGLTGADWYELVIDAAVTGDPAKRKAAESALGSPEVRAVAHGNALLTAYLLLAMPDSAASILLEKAKQGVGTVLNARDPYVVKQMGDNARFKQYLKLVHL